MPSIIDAGGAAPATIALTFCVMPARIASGADDRSRAIVVDTLAADRVEDRLRVDLAQAHVRAAERGDGPREAPAVAMEHRQRPEIARVVRHRPRRRVADRVQVGAAVMRDDALRIARRARCVRDGDRVPFVGRRIEAHQRRLRFQERFVLVRAEPLAGARELAVADVDDDSAPHVVVAVRAKRSRPS